MTSTPSLIAVLGVFAAACGAEPNATSPVTQIGSHVIPVESERTTQAPPDWKIVEQQLADLGLGQQPSSVQEFLPREGQYTAFGQPLFRHDSCGIATNLASIDHFVDEVSTRYHTYLNDYLVESDDGYGQDVLKTIDCEFTGHLYRCDTTVDKVDFRSFGLDAIVTIVNNDFGNWQDPAGSLPSGEGYVGVFTHEISCKGKDCAKEPCASLFGFLTKPLPCSGDEADEFGL